MNETTKEQERNKSRTRKKINRSRRGIRGKKMEQDNNIQQLHALVFKWRAQDPLYRFQNERLSKSTHKQQQQQQQQR